VRSASALRTLFAHIIRKNNFSKIITEDKVFHKNFYFFDLLIFNFLMRSKSFPKRKFVDKFFEKYFAVYITFCSFAVQIKQSPFPWAFSMHKT
jgi:hypothetical protein